MPKHSTYRLTYSPKNLQKLPDCMKSQWLRSFPLSKSKPEIPRGLLDSGVRVCRVWLSWFPLADRDHCLSFVSHTSYCQSQIL